MGNKSIFKFLITVLLFDITALLILGGWQGYKYAKFQYENRIEQERLNQFAETVNAKHYSSTSPSEDAPDSPSPSPTLLPVVNVAPSPVPKIEKAKFYSNKLLGFEFSYPNNLFTTQRRNDPTKSVVLTNEDDSNPLSNSKAVNILISFRSIPQNKSLVEYVTSDGRYNSQKLQVNNLSGYVYEQGAEGVNLAAVFEHNKKIYEITLIRHEAGDSYADNPQAIIYFYQIVNSFKLLD